jgi:hypothetical protein
MAAQILSFFEHTARSRRDWSQQELAEFYRVESALVQAGVQLETDRGVSDEGDPWFVFCRSDTGDVFIHFAFIDGMYVADGAAFSEPARGADFAVLVRTLIARYPLAQARERAGSNIFVHPAALLIALVGAAFFHSNEAKAAEASDVEKVVSRRASLIIVSQPAANAATPQAVAWADSTAAQAAAVILSAILTLNDDLFVAPHTAADTQGALGEIGANSPQFQSTAQPAATQAFTHESFVDLAIRPPGQDATEHNRLQVTDLAIQASLNSLQGLPEPSRETMKAGLGADSALASPVADATIIFPAASSAKSVFLFKAASLPAATTDATEAVAAAAATTGTNGALYDLAAKATSQVDTLPATLADLINRGEHLNADGRETSLTQAPASTSPQGGTVHEPRPPTPSPTPKGHDPAIDAAIAQFVSHVDHLEVVAQGKALILFDQDIFSPLMPDLTLASVTYIFEDGSSVSLVGTAQELSYFV